MTEGNSGLPWRPVVLMVVLAVLVGYAGKFHFIYGAHVTLQKLPKVSWSLAETVVNVDEVGGLPMLVARAKYPLFLRAVELAKE